MLILCKEEEKGKRRRIPRGDRCFCGGEGAGVRAGQEFLREVRPLREL